MKKRILVPIDFQVESLNTLKLALKQHADNEVIVHLVYGELLDESITRMLFYDPAKIIKKRTTKSFADALSIIRNRYSKNIADFHIELFHGYTITSFKLFALDRNIDEVYLPRTYRMKETSGSINLVDFASRTSLPVKWVEWETNQSYATADELAVLFAG